MNAADASVSVPVLGDPRRFRGLWVVAVWEERAHLVARISAPVLACRAQTNPADLNVDLGVGITLRSPAGGLLESARQRAFQLH